MLPFTPGFAVVPRRDGAQGLSAVVEGFVSAPPPTHTSHSPKDPVARGGRETLSTVTKAKTLGLTYCPPKQLEVFEVLFGAYSSESLCQGGDFHY